jgi:hypothetical protein
MNAKEIVSHEAQRLGFRPSGVDWTLSIAGKPTLTMTINDRGKVMVTGPGAELKNALDPRDEKFPIRLRKRIARITKDSVRVAKSQKKEQKVIAQTKEISRIPESGSRMDPLWIDICSYDALAYCDTCKRMLRESEMKTEHECLLCADEKEWNKERRRK